MISTQTSSSATEATASLLSELSNATFLGHANHCRADFYTFDGAYHPMLMHLVCQLRDEAFQSVGITMSDSLATERADIDGTCRQLIVWDRTNNTIMGGYRYAIGRYVRPEQLPLAHHYRLSERFCKLFLPNGIELSRSFINVTYQQRNNPLTLYALDSLWEALAHVVNATSTRYLFGRVSFYPSLGARATNLVVGFMRHAFAPYDPLITAHHPLDIGISRLSFERIFQAETQTLNYRTLLRLIHLMGRRIPPIVTSYMRLSPSMRTFDAYLNSDLGNITEAAIMLDMNDLYDDVKRRYNIHTVQQHVAIA